MKLFKSMGSIVTILCCLLLGEKNPWIVGVHAAAVTYTIQSDKSSYVYGSEITLSCTSSNGTPISMMESNAIYIYEANVTEYLPTNEQEYPASYTYVSSGSDVTTLVDFGFGKYKAVFYAEEYKNYSAVSNIFEVTKPVGVTIQTDQSTYAYGTDIIVTVNLPIGFEFTGSESIGMYRENSDSISFDSAEYGINDATTTFYTNDWGWGTYKAAFYIYQQHGEGIIATSSSFIITPPVNPNIYLDQTMYRYGDTMMITCNRTDGIACTDGDRVMIRTATSDEFIHMNFDGFDPNPLSLPISWGWGTFQAILLMGYDENEQKRDISDPFQVMEPTVAIATNKMTYELGDKMTFTATRADGGMFTENDYIAILPENSTTLYGDMIDAYRGSAESFWKFSITTDWTPGRYKIGLVLGNRDEPFVVTSAFEVKKKLANPITVWTNKKVYNYGDRMFIGWNRTDGKSFRPRDYIQIVRGGDVILDYSNTKHYYEMYLRRQRRMSFHIHWGYGKFQVVLYNRLHQIRAVSEDIEVFPPTGISVTTDKNLYTYGDSMTITFKSEKKYKFRDSDAYSIVTSGPTTDTYGYNRLSPLDGETVITTTVDFLAGGDLRIDLLNDIDQPLATSNPFQVVRPTNVIVSTDQTMYQVGNTMTVSVTDVSIYDDTNSLSMLVVPENTTTIQEMFETFSLAYVDYQSPNTIIPIDWSPGKYKVVLVHHGSVTLYIVSTSQVFNVQP
jgi:hypothetical protein